MMKNQYNFLKAIDTSSSSPDIQTNNQSNSTNNASNPNTNSTSQDFLLPASGQQAATAAPAPAHASNQAIQLLSKSNGGGGLGRKLHNLVASKFTSSASSSNNLARLSHHQQQQQLQNGLAKTKIDPKQQDSSPSYSYQKHRGSYLNLNPSVQQQQLVMPYNENERELAKCYEEIDQIYDYIRGLAPLPASLRKLKSIDFEQIEREKLRFQERQQRQLAAPTPSRPAQPASSRGQPAGPRSARQQQQQQLLARPPLVSTARDAQAAKMPTTIRVLTRTSETKRPSIKRVESLNLAPQCSPEPVVDTQRQHATGGSKQVAGEAEPLRTGSGGGGGPTAQRARLFRLPRAHSTSTLNQQQQQSRLRPARQEVGREKFEEEADDDENAQQVTRTLPIVRLADGKRVSSASASASAEQSAEEGGERGSSEQTNSSSSMRSDTIRGQQTSQSQRRSWGCNSSGELLKSHSDYDNDSPSSLTSCSTSSSESELDDKRRRQRRELDEATTPSRRPKLEAPQRHRGSSQASSSGRPTNSVSSVDSDDQAAGERDHDHGAGKPAASKTEHIYEQIPAAHLVQACSRPVPAPLVALGAATKTRTTPAAAVAPVGAHRKSSKSSSGSSGAAQVVGKQTRPSSTSCRPRAIRDEDKSHLLLMGQQQPHKQRLRWELAELGGQARPTHLSHGLISYPVAYAANVAAAAAHAARAPSSTTTTTTSSPSKRRQQMAALQMPYQQQQQQPQRHRHQHQLIYQHQGPFGPLHSRLPPSTPHLNSSLKLWRPLADVAYRQRLSMGNLNLLQAAYTNCQQQQQLRYPPRYQPQYQHQHHPPLLATASLEAQAAKLSRSASSGKVNRAPRLSPGQLIAQIQMPRAVSKRQVAPQQQQAAATNAAPTRFIWQRPPVAASTNSRQAGSLGRPASRRLTAIGIEQTALDQLLLDQMSRAGTNKDDQQQGTGAVAGGARRRRAHSGQQQHQAHFEPAQLMGAPLIDDDQQSSISSGHEAAAAAVATGANRSNKTSKTKQAADPVRCLNSISDLRSFSSPSNSSSSSSSSSPSSGGSTSSSASGGHLEQVDRVGETRAVRPAAGGGDDDDDCGNFVASRSFIKCYYGREEACDTTTAAAEAAAAAPKTTSQPVKQKRPSRLLSLIGLDTIGGGGGSGQKAQNGKLQSAESKASGGPRRGSEPRQESAKVGGQLGAPRRMSSVLTTTATNQAVGEQQPEQLRQLVGSLVRHFKHPTVRVAKVPKCHNAAPTATTTTTTTASSSTSSYEAAIKSSQAREPTALAKSAGSAKVPAAPTSNSQQHQSALIKVPKLSKQSHFLTNRPLPKLPPQASLSASSRRLPLAHDKQPSLSSKLSAAPQPKSQRKSSLVSTDLDYHHQQQQELIGGQQLEAQREPRKKSIGGSKVNPTTSTTTTTSSASASTSEANHLSPTATATTTTTAYTSSGISSRLTAGTQGRAAGPANRSSGGRPRASGSGQSSSSLTRSSQSSGGGGGGQARARRGPPKSHQADQDDGDDDGEEDDDDEEEDDEEEEEQEGNLAIKSRNDGLLTARDNLRLFDEKFSSSKFIELASSNDSLLESINFSGTLNSRLRGPVRNSDQMQQQHQRKQSNLAKFNN